MSTLLAFLRTGSICGRVATRSWAWAAAGVSVGGAVTWFGIEFDESTGHAHSALADARVSAKLLKQMTEGDYRVSPRVQEIRQRWGMGERAQTRLSNKCPELGDLLLKLKAEGR